jgi:hypothetical protein
VFVLREAQNSGLFLGRQSFQQKHFEINELDFVDINKIISQLKNVKQWIYIHKGIAIC